MKKFAFTTILLIVLLFPLYQGESGSYYTGEAISYKNSVIVGIIDSGNLEILQYNNNTSAISTSSLQGGRQPEQVGKITKTGELTTSEGYFDGSFSDLIFNVESDKLYVYLVNGKYLYKYDISDLSNFKLEKKVTDGLWGWMNGVMKTDGQIVTIGAKKLKIWDYDLKVQEEFDVMNNLFNNIGFNPIGDIVYNVDNKNDKVELFSRKARKVFTEIEINANEDHDRKLYFNDVLEEVFIVDDDALLVYDYNGDKLREFPHIGRFGYDVAGLTSGNNIYFTDGVGVVKLDKRTMIPLRWKFTTDLGSGNGWAMGLRVVPIENEEIVIIFNHSSILILNKNLDLLDSYKVEDFSL